MNQTMPAQETIAKNTTREQLKLQIAQYLEQQPESTRVFHKWMKGLEAASLCISIGIFILAMYLSINWQTVGGTAIATAWFAFPVSFSLTVLLYGLHTVVLRALPPFILPGKNEVFVAGSKAVGRGWAFLLSGLAGMAFWGVIAYAVWTFNLSLLQPLISILGVVLGYGIAISILVSIVWAVYQKIVKSH